MDTNEMIQTHHTISAEIRERQHALRCVEMDLVERLVTTNQHGFLKLNWTAINHETKNGLLFR